MQQTARKTIFFAINSFLEFSFVFFCLRLTDFLGNNSFLISHLMCGRLMSFLWRIGFAVKIEISSMKWLDNRKFLSTLVRLIVNLETWNSNGDFLFQFLNLKVSRFKDNCPKNTENWLSSSYILTKSKTLPKENSEGDKLHFLHR